jgi:hypothetical protein
MPETRARRLRAAPDKPTAPREVHPAAAVWPMLADDELHALADDIAANGLIHPIVLTPDGEVLDGRNRLAACELAKIEPKFETYDGDPLKFVLGSNSQRKHNTKGQRALAGWLSILQFEESPKQRDAVAAIGVTASDVGKAAMVAKWCPELVGAVINGTTPIDHAYSAAQDKKRAADDEAKARESLAKEFPALLARVDRDELTVAEALTLGRAERAEKRKHDIVAMERLARNVISLLDLTSRSKQLAAAQLWRDYHTEVVASEVVTPENMRAAAAALNGLADLDGWTA